MRKLTQLLSSVVMLGALSAPVSSQAGDGVHILGLNIHTDTVVKQRVVNVPVYKNVPVYAHTCQGPEFLGYQHRFEGYCPQVKTVVREKLHVIREPCIRPYTCAPKPVTCAPATCAPVTCRPATCAPATQYQHPALAPPKN